eukprot:Hpha_TRINITY_DN26116_c0_g1::TRINITY_DN26116_c0_g1_i1::g.155485::m.155485
MGGKVIQLDVAMRARCEVLESHLGRRGAACGVSQDARREFEDQGVVRLRLECVRSPGVLDGLKESFEQLFKAKFETGNYPDEVHWRQGISKDSACREICNAWKADRRVASIVLSEELGRLACDLTGWPGARIGQDDVVWKTPGSSGVAYHTDAAYISNQFVPRDNNSVTIWIPIDPATPETGVVEYAVGSHKWDRAPTTQSAGSSTFHDPNMRSALDAAAAGRPCNIRVESLGPGDCFVHHQDVWHGSTPNTTPSTHRRALVCHLIRSDVTFREGDWRKGDPGAADYIYGRYKMLGSNALLEDFFPITYSRNGYRTPWLADYLKAA